MTENTNENEQAHQQLSSQASVTEKVGEAMPRLRICPRKVLGPLAHLRIERTRIKPIENRAPKRSGKTDVEAAILTQSRPSNSSKPKVTEYVAVKKLRFDSETDGNRALAPFAHEVGLLNDLSHPNVVKIVGFVEDVDNGVAWLVFTWEKNGNLREFVRSGNWELPERVSLINDVVTGLGYLHGRSPPICHGDLKSLNILVNSENRAVITDFGSARSLDPATEQVAGGVNVAKATKIQLQTSTGETTIKSLKAEVAPSGEFITMTGPAYTLRWAAPELLHGVPPSLGSDVWAFGWICWEAITGNFPFEEENNMVVFQRIVKWDRLRINNNAQFDQIKMLCGLMEECLRLDVNKRPPVVRCQQVLSFMHKTTPSGGGNSLGTPRSTGLLHALGWIQLQSGVTAKAQEYFQQSLDASKVVGDEQGKARALHAMGEVYRREGQYSNAAESYSQSRDLYSKIGDQEGFAKSVKALGDVYCVRSEYSTAEGLYIQSRDVYSKTGHLLGLAQSFKALGEVYYMRHEYSKAEKSYIRSIYLFSKIGDQLGFAQSVRALGELYYMREEYSKAEESYIQSRDLFFNIGHQLGVAQSVNALGDVYRMRNEDSKAEELYIQSRDLYSSVGDLLGVANAVRALGEVYNKRHEDSKAEESYIQSRDLYSKIGNQLGFAHSLRGLGRVQAHRREYARAGQSYLEAQRIYHQIGNRQSLAHILWHLGSLHAMQEQYVEAERLVRGASTIYGELGMKTDVEDCDAFLTAVRPSLERDRRRRRGYLWGFYPWSVTTVILVPALGFLMHLILRDPSSH